MIRVLLFDIGGVLMQGRLNDALRDFATERGIDGELLVRLRNEHVDEMRVGRMSLLALFHAAGITGDSEELIVAWTVVGQRHMSLNRFLLKKIAGWRIAGIRTAILSNVSELRTPIDRAYDFYAGFDPVILSNEVGLTKPDPRIYAHALRILDVPADEIAFIDDMKEFLVPARTLGMHALRFTNNETLLGDLAALGLPGF